MLVNCKSTFGYNFGSDTITSLYLKDVRRYPLLNTEEERELIKQFKHGKTEKEREDAKNKLIQSNLRFVISVARKLGDRENFHDLVSEGNIGLMKALDRFDLSCKCKLTTYAVSWIMVQMQEYQMRKQKIVIPKNISKLTRYVKHAIDELYAENERKPYYDEIAARIKEKYNYNVVNLTDVTLGDKIVSISEKYDTKDRDCNTFEDGPVFTSVTSNNNIDKFINDDSSTIEAQFFLSKLNERERYIVVNKHGIGCEPLTLEQIGVRLELGKERVRQIYAESLKKMRQYC